MQSDAGLLSAVVSPTGDFQSWNSFEHELFERYSPGVLLTFASNVPHRPTHCNLFHTYPFVPCLSPPTESNTIRRTLSSSPPRLRALERAYAQMLSSVQGSAVRSARLFFARSIRSAIRTSLLSGSPQQPIEAFVAE